MIQRVTYVGKGISRPYEDWVGRGCPEDTWITYATHTLETSDFFLMAPHLNLFYMYVDMDWATVEAAVQFKADRGNRTFIMTGAVCRTSNIWPEMMSHLALAYGTHLGGMDCFKKTMLNCDALGDVCKLFGQGWTPSSGRRRGSLLPRSALEQARAYYDACNPRGSITWSTVIAHYDTTRSDAATRIQAAYRGWRVRLKYRYSPYNRLGRHLVMEMMTNMKKENAHRVFFN
jgi:hypothetical protein